MRKATISSIRPNQYVVPHHPVARMRASRIRVELGVQGINVLDDLPPVRSELELVLRSPQEVASRVCALVAISELASWWHTRGISILPQVEERFPHGAAAFSLEEAAFAQLVRQGDRSPEVINEALQLSWSYAAFVPLAHVLGKLEVPAQMRGRGKPCLDELAILHPHEFIPWIAELGSEEFLAQCTTLADLDEICDFYEYVRSLRWVAVDETLRPEDHHFIDGSTGSTLLEWHKALAWLTNPAAEWDRVQLHT